MDKVEREALAVDIARRVRLLCVQDVPKSFLDLLAENWEQTIQLYTKKSSDYGRVRIIVRHGALHIEFEVNSQPVARFRFDEDPDR